VGFTGVAGGLRVWAFVGSAVLGGCHSSSASTEPHGIGTDWKWQGGVEARLAGPYAPCGAIGTGSISWAAASPAGDELAVASRSGLVVFFTLPAGKQTRKPFDAQSPVSSVAYSSDASRLIVAADDGVTILRLADESVLSSSKPFSGVTGAASLSPDGSRLAALGWDDGVAVKSSLPDLRLIDVADGTVVLRVLGVDAAAGVVPQFSTDGTVLAAGPIVVSLNDLQPFPFSLPDAAGNGALSPDGKLFARGGAVWDVATHDMVRSPGASPVAWVAFSPDGATYAESYGDINGSGTLVGLFHATDWSSIVKGSIEIGDSFPGSDERFLFSGDGMRLLTSISPRHVSDSDRPVFQVRAVSDLALESTLSAPRPSTAGPFSFSPDGSLVAARLFSSSGVWRAADASPVSRIPEISDNYDFLGNGMLTLRRGTTYDPSDGRRVAPDLLPWLGISPDGTLAVSALLTSVAIVRLSDLSTVATLDASPNALNLWVFSRDNRFVAVAAGDSTPRQLLVFDVETGQKVAAVAGSAPMALTSSNGTTRLLGVPENGTKPRVWSIPDQTTLFDLDDSASTVDFSPDGSLIATGGATVRVYHADTGVLREEFAAHGEGGDPARSGVISVAFSPTGQIASVGLDETIRFSCSP
jgi:WD40 repeat protein